MLPLQLPPFWPTNPQVWFTRVEMHFHLWRISTQIARSCYVVACLPPQVADEIGDVLSQPPSENAYDRLRCALLARTMESERSQVQHLLTPQELGDRRPSQLLHRMHRLLSSETSDNQDTMLRGLFLSKLPEGMRMILAAAEDASLDRLVVVIADRTADHYALTVRAVTMHASHSWQMVVARMEAKIEQLVATFATFRPSQDRPAGLRQHSFSRALSNCRRTSNPTDYFSRFKQILRPRAR